MFTCGKGGIYNVDVLTSHKDILARLTNVRCCSSIYIMNIHTHIIIVRVWNVINVHGTGTLTGLSLL